MFNKVTSNSQTSGTGTQGHTVDEFKAEVKNRVQRDKKKLADEGYMVKTKHIMTQVREEVNRGTARVARRQEIINQVKAIVEQSAGLSTEGKILKVLAAGLDPSIYELAMGFHNVATIAKKKKNIGEQAADRLNEIIYITRMRQQLMNFRKSDMGEYFVLRAIVNPQNQWVIKLFKTEKEYTDKHIDDSVKARLEGMKELNKHDHEVLAMSYAERKAHIAEQIKMQEMKLRALSKQ